MNYLSTRDPAKKPYSAAQVIKMGLAPDGGLFIPEEIPSLRKADVDALCQMSYAERAAKILSMYLSDYTYEELLKDCTDAYCETSFPGGAAPLVHVKDNVYSLELWHGPMNDEHSFKSADHASASKSSVLGSADIPSTCK